PMPRLAPVTNARLLSSLPIGLLRGPRAGTGGGEVVPHGLDELGVQALASELDGGGDALGVRPSVTDDGEAVHPEEGPSAALRLRGQLADLADGGRVGADGLGEE